MQVVWYSHMLATHEVQFVASRHVAHGDTQGWHSLLASGYFPDTHAAAHLLVWESWYMRVLGAGRHDSQVVVLVLHL